LFSIDKGEKHFEIKQIKMNHFFKYL